MVCAWRAVHGETGQGRASARGRATVTLTMRYRLVGCGKGWVVVAWILFFTECGLSKWGLWGEEERAFFGALSGLFRSRGTADGRHLTRTGRAGSAGHAPLLQCMDCCWIGLMMGVRIICCDYYAPA